ncbi:MAG: TldD/PmbA family protein [Corallococcus sp.]|nr:TldD/PmbA family protein [Corallococcus sp.]
MYLFKEGFYSDIRIETRYTSNVTYKNGDLDECSENTTQKAFIRVFDGQMWYYASTTAVAAVQGELDNLYRYAAANKNISENPVVKRFQVNKDVALKFSDCKVSDITLQEKCNYLTSVLGKLKSDYCKLVTGIYIDRYSVYEFYSSKGADLKYDFQTSGVSFAMTYAKDAEQFTHTLQRCQMKFQDIKITDSDISEFIKEGENFLLNAKPLDKAGKYPVVLSPLVTGVFAHESFGHKSEADFMLGDETLAKEWCIGKKVGSDVLTIVDCGSKLGSGYTPYDDEGTKASTTYLIKDGILTGRLHSAATAAYLDETPTGNARAINCDFEPIVRMTNTYVEAGTSTFDELLEGIEYGFYIETFKHGSGMSTFTIAPNVAYEIKNGKLGAPVKIAVLTGNVFETLGLIDKVSKDVVLHSFVTGGCGKMEQYPLNVGLGGPYVRVSEMNVQ